MVMSVPGSPSELSDCQSEAPSSFDKDREHMHRRMLSSVSHDLKTPLVSIIGSLEIYERMQDTLPREQQLELIHVALQEAHRLNNFITDILDRAGRDNGLVSVRQERV